MMTRKVRTDRPHGVSANGLLRMGFWRTTYPCLDGELEMFRRYFPERSFVTHQDNEPESPLCMRNPCADKPRLGTKLLDEGSLCTA